MSLVLNFLITIQRSGYDEKYKKECLQPTEVEGSVTAIKYIELLEEHLLPFMNARTEYVFQDDNAPAHTARVVK